MSDAGGLKLYLDEHLSTLIASGLREAGVDVVTTREASNTGLHDGGQLAYATAEGRALVTMDVRDFLVLIRESRPASRPHAGVILLAGCQGNEFGPIIAALRRMATHYPKGLDGQVVWLSPLAPPPAP